MARLTERTHEIRTVEVEDEGATFYIRTLTSDELDVFDLASADRRRVRANLLVRCLCDDSGKRLYADEDAEELGQAPGWLADILFAEALSLNRLGERDYSVPVARARTRAESPPPADVSSIRAAMQTLESMGMARRVEAA